jgi:type I protein arginine methyltransferase
VADALGVDETPFSFPVQTHEVVSAFAGWFDADFAGSKENPAPNPVTLSTHPAIGYTHWGQQVFFLGEKIDLFPGDELKGNITMFRTKDSARLYHVTIEYTVVRSNPSAEAFVPVKATWEMP